MHSLDGCGGIVGVGQDKLDASTDRVPIRGGAISNQAKGNRTVFGGSVVPHQAQSRAGPVGSPEIEVSILIPIGDPDTSAVVGKIEACYRRDRRKTVLTGIQEAAVSFASAE